jgi:hypothetical protein
MAKPLWLVNTGATIDGAANLLPLLVADLPVGLFDVLQLLILPSNESIDRSLSLLHRISNTVSGYYCNTMSYFTYIDNYSISQQRKDT